MNSGQLYIDAGEVAVAIRAVERWSPTTASRKDARVVVGLLERGRAKTDLLIGKWRQRMLDLETIAIESQDLSPEDVIFFAKQNEIHKVKSVEDSPHEDGYLRITFESGWFLDCGPDDSFDVVT